jgi:hypothetical protein
MMNDYFEYLQEIDPEAYAAYEEEERLERIEFEKSMDDLKAVARTPEGVRVIRSILDLLGMFSAAFTGNSKTYYNLGRREAAQDIFSLLTLADPKSAQQVLLEGYRKAARQKVLKGKDNGGRTSTGPRAE